MLTSTQNNTSHLLRVMMSFSSGASLLFPSNYQWAEIAWFCPGRGFVNAGTSAGNQVIRWRRNPSRLSNISWHLRHKPQRKITQHHKETAAWDVSLFTLTTSTWCFVHPLDVRHKCASVRLLFFWEYHTALLLTLTKTAVIYEKLLSKPVSNALATAQNTLATTQQHVKTHSEHRNN